MTILRPLSLLSVLFVWFSATLQADTLLNGIASHTEFRKEQYLSALYVTSTSDDRATLLESVEPQKMVLRITAKRIPSRSFRDSWLQRIAINNAEATLVEQAPAMAEFAKMIRFSYRKGDQLTFQLTAEGSTIINLNGVVLGTIHNSGFYQALLRTWLGPVPINSNFRQQILSAGDVNAEALERFNATTPTPQRISKIKAILIKKALAIEPTAKPVLVAKLEAPKLKVEATPVVAKSPEQGEEAKLEAVLKTAVTEGTATDAATETPPETPPEELVMILDDDELEEEDSNEEEITAASILSRQLYHSKLVKWTFQHVKYPKRAIKRNQEGHVLLEITINRDGQVVLERILEAAKFNTLNTAAKKAIAKASPFPVIPAEILDEQFVFSLPITFRLPK